MSKTPQKTHSQKEHLAGRNKKLEAENRRLRKENKALRKRAHMYENVIEDVTDNVEKEEKKKICEACGKGEIEVFDFKFIIVETCNLCGDQKKWSKRKKE